MVDWVTLIPTVAAILIAVISYYQQNRVIRQQAVEIRQQAEQLQEFRKGERRERIERYYPPLAENLRLSLPDIANKYRMGTVVEHSNYFNVLIEMANQSTLSIIEALDNVLYYDLKAILTDFIPAEKELDKRKDESWKVIPRNWIIWIKKNNNELSMLSGTPEEFVNQMANSLLWPLWRDDEYLIRQNFGRTYESYIMTQSDKLKSMNWRELIYREFLRIVEDEWIPIKDGYQQLHVDLRDLVENSILPRMDATLKSLGE